MPRLRIGDVYLRRADVSAVVASAKQILHIDTHLTELRCGMLTVRPPGERGDAGVSAKCDRDGLVVRAREGSIGLVAASVVWLARPGDASREGDAAREGEA